MKTFQEPAGVVRQLMKALYVASVEGEFADNLSSGLADEAMAVGRQYLLDSGSGDVTDKELFDQYVAAKRRHQEGGD